MTAVGLIVAAGVGQRLGGNGRKGFAALAGDPLLVHVVRTFVACEAIDSIVLVVAPDCLELAADALDRADLTADAIVAGGASRRESVSRGLAACPAAAQVVAVHDAARPLVSVELVARTVGALVEPWAAVAPGLPIVDTMKLLDTAVAGGADGGRVVRTVERLGLWSVQTPQVFEIDTLRAAHGASDDPVTDDLMLVERAGGNVLVIQGDRRNFKITYPEDLLIAEALLGSGRRQ